MQTYYHYTLILNIMTQLIIYILISTVVILLWAINTLIPRKSKIRMVLNIVVMIAVVVTLFTTC